MVRSYLISGFFLLCAHFVLGQKNISFLGYLPYNDNLNDVWGYVDTNGLEYAFVGVKTGVSLVDVNDPAIPSELFFIPGPTSTWREIKVWNKHAYVTNEKSGGLRIIDLNQFPDSVTSYRWHGPNYEFWSAHNIQVDENGYGYLLGYNDTTGDIPYEERGALIIDLNGDPLNPAIVGTYSDGYVHDCFVRGDTMWTAEIGNDYFGVVDVSDKGNPVLLSSQNTPNNQTHNCWLSDDGNYIFTTDEIVGAYVTAYNVSDLGNITELDRIRTDPGLGIVPHNTFFYQNYLVTSYYTSGVTIVDAHRPQNLVEVGKFDTSPLATPEFKGCWGVYPYLPSGIILASDMQEGLFVLQPDYQRGCYLEGNVTNTSTGFALNGVQVDFLGHDITESTDLLGEYKTGIADSGFYTVRFYVLGCITRIVSGVHLQTGQITTLNEQLVCDQGVGINTNASSKSQLRIHPIFFHVETQIDVFVSKNSVLSLLDLNGRVVARFVLNGQSFITIGSDLPVGSYLVQLETEGKTIVERMVKY